MQVFVSKVPLPNLDILQYLMTHDNGSQVVNPVFALDAVMPTPQAYPHMEAIYKTAALDSKILKDAGQAIFDIGGISLMRVSFEVSQGFQIFQVLQVFRSQT